MLFASNVLRVFSLSSKQCKQALKKPRKLSCQICHWTVQIVITVRSQDGAGVLLKVMPGTACQSIFSAVCAKRGMECRDAKFLYQGDVIDGSLTVGQYDMEDGDVIDMLVSQVGD